MDDQPVESAGRQRRLCVMLVIRKLCAMGSISGTFALAAFIAGLFCTRLKTALIAGAVPAFL